MLHFSVGQCSGSSQLVLLYCLQLICVYSRSLLWRHCKTASVLAQLNCYCCKFCSQSDGSVQLLVCWRYTIVATAVFAAFVCIVGGGSDGIVAGECLPSLMAYLNLYNDSAFCNIASGKVVAELLRQGILKEVIACMRYTAVVSYVDTTLTTNNNTYFVIFRKCLLSRINSKTFLIEICETETNDAVQHPQTHPTIQHQPMCTYSPDNSSTTNHCHNVYVWQ